MWKRAGRNGYLLALLLFALSACSEQALDFFFDIPPPTPQELAEEAAAERQKAEAEAKARQPAADGEDLDDEPAEPPAIEAVQVYDQVAEMLPKDDFDEIDWMAALDEGLIRPRAALKGRGRPEQRIFGFDFYLPGPDPSMDAYFPHSAHTQWLGCDSCHPKIFRVRGTEITMDDVFEGKYCGVCHGVVAFAVDNCVRCHTAMEE